MKELMRQNMIYNVFFFYLSRLCTHSEVVKVVGPVLELFVGATCHTEVSGDVLHRGVGRHTGKDIARL